MKRRSVMASLGAALIGRTALVQGATPDMPSAPVGSWSQAQTPTPAAEIEPFQKIAKAKGARFTVLKEGAVIAAQAAPKSLHLDMDMIRASIQNAIGRTKQDASLNQRLQRLLANGTASQQVEFVYGTGTYYFPEDIEAAVKATGEQRCVICGPLCMFVCWCVGDRNVQQCKEHCRDVCKPC